MRRESKAEASGFVKVSEHSFPVFHAGWQLLKCSLSHPALSAARSIEVQFMAAGGHKQDTTFCMHSFAFYNFQNRNDLRKVI